MTSASSPVHSPKVRVCTDAKSLDGRHRVRRRGVSPTGSETFRYLFSDPMFLGLRLLDVRVSEYPESVQSRVSSFYCLPPTVVIVLSCYRVIG